MARKTEGQVTIDSPEAFFNRELSWLAFARRVLALVEDPELQLLERIKFAGIMGVLHDEYFMKRAGGLKRQIKQGKERLSLDGRTPQQELLDCRTVILEQMTVLARAIEHDLRPGLAAAGIPILDYDQLEEHQRHYAAGYFEDQVLPILTPLAVDAEHPFPFISSGALNLAVQLRDTETRSKRFVRVKVPDNRPRWVPLPDGAGFVPIEQVIAHNLGQLFPDDAILRAFLFRVTRGAEGEAAPSRDLLEQPLDLPPGFIISQVTDELKARRFAGIVRLQVQPDMPDKLVSWLAEQLGADGIDIFPTPYFMGLADLLRFKVEGHPELRYPPHEPALHPRLARLDHGDPDALFAEIRRGPILMHHPYHSFDSSVLRFLQCAAYDPKVLAIKLTIYRTSSDSPIIAALVEAARRGKQVAVLVEITARFDEAPNINWGQRLEQEGAHVAYGVEKLKTHVKLAMAIRDEPEGIRRYVHVGTGNYHTGTARIYEDLGVLTCDPEIGEDASHVFNELTGASPHKHYRKLLVAPRFLRDGFIALIRREIEHAKAGRPCGIRAKMNQLEDRTMIQELYQASQAGVPVSLVVRGLNCLRPGVPGLSDKIKVCSVVGRFLEHSRIYQFVNGGEDEFLIGSADWMRRNLDRRMETITPVTDVELKRQLKAMLDIYEADNYSAWDCQPDGSYLRRRPEKGEPPRAAQDVFIWLAAEEAHGASSW